ncbi:MAG: B12-binding domain-containing radical SAM protein [Syntrophobacterales bacterium]|nr:B12-binding domain-containing radical SAM protein [Syntrophobacterales bacterium]
MKSLKILFLQLPLQSHDYCYNLAHVPLAGGVLSAFLHSRIPQAEVSLLDPLVTCCGSTTSICHSILSEDPDVVAMSCYLWNTERSLYIAHKLRKEGSKALIMAGGPDVHPDNTILNTPDCPFDLFIVGEGEGALLETIYHLITSGDLSVAPRTFIKSAPTELVEIPSPYIKGFLSPPFEGPLLIESSRGCPYRCKYCYYHHNASGVTAFPYERIIEEISWARSSGIREITFVDPSFTSRPNLKGLLDLLISANKDGFFSFYAELNAEFCDDDLALRLAKAGFKQVEVGLQSTNPKALKAIGRPVKLEALKRGIRALKSKGIKVMVDLIVGLPEDTKEDLFRAIDLCLSEDLFDELSLYPLSLLPGTVLRNQAKRMNIIYDPLPPYYARRTSWINEEDIKLVFQYAEEVTAIDYFPPEPPIKDPPLRSVLWTLKPEDDLKSWCRAILEHPAIGQALIFELDKEDWWLERELLEEFIRELLERDPFLLISWIIKEKSLSSLPENIRLKILKSLFVDRNHYKDREWFSTSSSTKSIQVFVEILANEGKTLLWITPELTYRKDKELWLITTCDERDFEKEAIFLRACQLLGISRNTPYRIVFTH